jgi:hypothetical protein
MADQPDESGTGKSALLQALLLQEVSAGRGIVLLDPHGDLTKSLLSLLPSLIHLKIQRNGRSGFDEICTQAASVLDALERELSEIEARPAGDEKERD